MPIMLALCLMLAHNVSIEAEWIPRSENQVADFIRMTGNLIQGYFTHYRLGGVHVQWWCPCTMDRFASYYNTQL